MFLMLKFLITKILLFSIFQSFHPIQHLNYLNFSIQTLCTLLISTLSQPHTILNILNNFLDWMNKTSNSQSNIWQKETVYPHIIFSLDRKDYTTANSQLCWFFTSHLSTQYHPPELPFAAIWVCTRTLNLLIIVDPTCADSKIFYCDNCLTLGQWLTSKLRP